MAKLTYPDFLREIRKFRGRFRLNGKDIRAYARFRQYGYCPVAAVSVARGEENTCDVTFLPRTVRDSIVNAADGERGYEQVRYDLLKALGLSERS